MKSISKLLGCGLPLFLFLVSSIAAAQSLQLVDAAKSQEWGHLQSLLEQKSDVNAAHADGTTALAWSVYWDNLQSAELLIKAGADVNAGNYLGVTPLLLANKNRSVEMVALLLNADADPNKTMWSGEAPLMTAARTGVNDILNLLLDHGADINYREPRRGQSALMWAISFGHPAAARLLIDRKADITARTKKLTEPEQYTPMLMEGYGGNVEAVPQGGYTPLMFAAKEGDIETTRLLLERGAGVNDVSVEDGTALVIASAERYEELALELLEQGADPKIPDANGMTALHYALRDGLKALIGHVSVTTKRVCGFILEAPCKALETLTEQDRLELGAAASLLYVVEGETNPLAYERKNRMILPGKNMYELAEALLARGADVNAAMKYPPARIRLERGSWLNLAGATPYFLALASFDETAMEMLLEHGANPVVSTDVNKEVFLEQTKSIADDNQVFGNGSTLMIAVGLGKKVVFTQEEEKKAVTAAKRLIGFGADVNEATATGWTALHAAAYVGASSLVQLLLDNGAKVNVKNGCGRTPLSIAEAENNVGLIRGFKPNPETVALLQKHGATKSDAGTSAGECVLGRYRS